MEGYGVKASEIRVVGGGSKNRLWRRIIADSFQLPLKFPTEPESAALGAALQAAAVHAGVAAPEFIDSHSPPLADTVRSRNLMQLLCVRFMCFCTSVVLMLKLTGSGWLARG